MTKLKQLKQLIRQIKTEELTTLTINLEQLPFLSQKSFCKLCKIISQNNSIQSLNFVSDGLYHWHIPEIKKTLESSQSITELDLSSNRIDDYGAAGIAELIKANSYLKKLDLSLNQFGRYGIDLIADSLRINNSLQTLNLNFNSFGSDGAEAIARIIKFNKSIRYLEFEFNSFHENDYGLFRQAIDENINLILTGKGLNLTAKYNLINRVISCAVIKPIAQLKTGDEAEGLLEKISNLTADFQAIKQQMKLANELTFRALMLFEQLDETAAFPIIRRNFDVNIGEIIKNMIGEEKLSETDIANLLGDTFE